MILIPGVIFVLLICAFLALEVAVGAKRGGCLESFRLFTVILAAVAAFGLATCVPSLTTQFYQMIPDELVPALSDMYMYFGVPVVALVLFFVLKLIMLLVYLIVAAILKKGKHSDVCMAPDSSMKKKGCVCGVLIVFIIAAAFTFPALRVYGLYQDYKANEKSVQTLWALSKRENVSNAQVLEAVDGLSSYVLDVKYISEPAKVKAINYGISLVNTTVASTGNEALASISLNSYSTIEEHKKQIESVVNVAKALEKTGMLDGVTDQLSGSDSNGGGASEGTVSGGINVNKMLDSVKDETVARELVVAVESLDNGGEMLSSVVNEAVKNLSGGEINNVVDPQAFANMKENEDAIVQTMMLADTFTSLSKEKYESMSNEEKAELVSKLNQIKALGVANADVCDGIIAQINASMQ